MINVYFTNKTHYLFRYKKIFKQIASETQKILKIKLDSEVNVIIVNNNEMTSISNEYKKINKPTDVLSFPSDWKELSKIIGYNMIGDIYISYEKVKSQAKEYNHSIKREWSYLFVHGLLHCFGYDHQNNEEEKEMNNLAKQILENVGVLRNE